MVSPLGRLGGESTEECTGLGDHERVVGGDTGGSEGALHESALATHLRAIGGERHHVITAREVDHVHLHAIRIDRAFAFEQFSGGLGCINKDKRETKDVEIGDATIVSCPLLSTKPEFRGGEVEDVSDKWKWTRTSRERKS